MHDYAGWLTGRRTKLNDATADEGSALIDNRKPSDLLEPYYDRGYLKRYYYD
jgi:hypothetical protein